VCDEPTAALDAHSGQTVMQLLRKVAVQPGRAVIVVTHDSRVLDFGDRVVHMEDGRIAPLEQPARIPPAEAFPDVSPELLRSELRNYEYRVL